MLAQTTVTNTESTVYTVPTGKKSLIEVIIYPSSICNVWMKINNSLLFDVIAEIQVSQKLICTSGDVIKVGTDGTVNVFISGMEV